VIEQLIQNHITSGHARAILSLETKEKQKEFCTVIIQKGLSVREAESLAKRWAGRPKSGGASQVRKGELTSQLNALQDTLRQRLATKVQIVPKGKKGKIEIEYYSFEDLDRIVEVIVGDET
jgi:ParB family chromosome partitioning protein